MVCSPIGHMRSTVRLEKILRHLQRHLDAWLLAVIPVTHTHPYFPDIAKMKSASKLTTSVMATGVVS